jgi:parvulin-like peptidyl-prolyl isomerase
VTFKDRLKAAAKETTLDQFMELTRPYLRQRMNTCISNTVLYKKAKRELARDYGDKVDEKLEGYVDKDWRQFVLEKGEGSEVVAEEVLKKKGMTRATYKEQTKRLILARYSLKLVTDRPITHGELVACYDEMKSEFAVPPLVQFRLIEIQPDKVEVKDPNENRLIKARVLAEDLARRVKDGANFAMLAEQQSHGLRRETGGLWPASDPNAFLPPYDAVAAKATELEVGQVAGPLDIGGRFFIVKLEQKRARGYQPLPEVQKKLEAKIAEDRREEAIKQIDAEIAAQTAMVDTNVFLDRCLEYVYRQARSGTRS